MNSNILCEFEKQIIVVLNQLEEHEKKAPSKAVDLIKKRYTDTLFAIKGNNLDAIKNRKISILGSVRAYLESASDYTNPMLEEMYKAEGLLNKLLSGI